MLDREVWAEFQSDWEGLTVESELLSQQLGESIIEANEPDDVELMQKNFTGEMRQVITTQRIKQQFFRRAVLSSYSGRCCMSGLSEPK